MKKLKNPKFIIFLLLIVKVIVVVGLLSPAFPATLVESLSEPIPIIINSNLDSSIITPGDGFSITIPDSLIYKNLSIKTNTTLAGNVIAVQSSKNFNRHGYIELHLKYVNISNSEWINLDSKFDKPLFIKLYNLDVQNNKYKRKIVPPIFRAASHILPFGIALNESVSVYSEFRNDISSEIGFMTKLKNGVFKGSGIPELVLFCKSGPNPNYKAGQYVEIRFKKNDLKKIFMLSI